MKTALVMAGGTGGHVFPGLAVADELARRGWRVVWLGHPDGMEARLVAAHGLPMEPLRFSGLRGKGPVALALLPWRLLRAFAASVGVLRRVRPQLVLGMGGYVSFPAGMMASLLGAPLVLHEQNSIAGLANRVLARLADRVATGFPDVLPGAAWCGNPVRADIAALPTPATRYDARSGPLRLLVVGGSLGAQVFNDTLPAALALLPEDARPVVLHQCGRGRAEAVRARYAAAGVSADVRDFLDDMPAAYAEADLVLCRAGAMTVAEVAAAGVAALFVPFPHAVDDHQTTNARFLAEREAALLLPQADLSVATLAERLSGLDRAALRALAVSAREQARPDATVAVADACEAAAAGRPQPHTVRP